MIYNKNATMLYKDTEVRYCNDVEVDPDDLITMCNILYQQELLTVFGLSLTEEVDFIGLTNKMEAVYERIKTDARIIEMIQKNFFQDNLTTFFSLFSYNTFYIVHPLICECLS